MSPPNKRKQLTESLLGTTYEREDLMRQEARTRRLARQRRREERSAEGDQRGHSGLDWAGRSPPCGGASNPPVRRTSRNNPSTHSGE